MHFSSSNSNLHLGEHRVCKSQWKSSSLNCCSSENEFCGKEEQVTFIQFQLYHRHSSSKEKKLAAALSYSAERGWASVVYFREKIAWSLIGVWSANTRLPRRKPRKLLRQRWRSHIDIKILNIQLKTDENFLTRWRFHNFEFPFSTTQFHQLCLSCKSPPLTKGIEKGGNFATPIGNSN